ncbi:glycosyltransferase [Hymenobacter sp. NST-14]|uniref:CgeB family protein n=1 Tax=Hymenobacter piscis TaxID=2839984 RepID=UPI001C026D90|nr:glycosyltransferase [Hymenobacter piscis]MBT9393034.1 glycosyltransferase [Hymenobacter piscis]
MKILLSIPGHTRTIPMGYFVEKALRELGHEVVVFNHEREDQLDRLREKISFKRFLARKNRLVLALAKTEKPDAFLTIYGKTHDAATLRQLREWGIPVLCWWLNDPFDLGTKHIPVAEYDHFFTNSRGTHAAYRDQGARHVHFLPVGIDPDTHRPLPAADKKYDIVFAGDWHTIREKVLLELVQHHKVALMGPWRRVIPKNSPLLPHFIQQGYFTPAEMAVAFNEARVVLNLHTWYGRWDYGVNPRLFEASGCRSFQVSDWKEEIPELYVPDQEIVLYRHSQELPELLTHWLARPAERAAVAEAALERTLRDHTYPQRMQQLLTVAGLD